ncbi:NTP transferase domain-containing protein [Saccharococcus caldoxylosilyticus]|uniref:NTP transferase domain-containing protein n=1 Tax=Saccharococcus caldoxylosilyticus TaxID=81408 RepID=UPI00031CD8CA|nr:NTP transferase domain-containing protein [Parageobacillus caldoxylosilyticus]
MNMSRIIGIYLAAGQSRRMGMDKRSLPFSGNTLGDAALKAAVLSLISHVLVVVPPDDTLTWLAPELAKHKKCTIIRCFDCSRGQAHSLRCGIKRAMQMQAEAIVILLADQPFITEAVINELIQLYEQYQADYISFTNNGIVMPPVLFARSTFFDLLLLDGDEGARKLLRNQSRWKGITQESTTEKIFFDIDTKEDYLHAIKQSEKKEGFDGYR